MALNSSTLSTSLLKCSNRARWKSPAVWTQVHRLSSTISTTTIRNKWTPYMTIPSSPPPTCPCQSMPPNLDIDYKRQLRNSVAPYSDHLLIHTATADWPSRIEDDARFPLAAQLKVALKREIVKALPARPANVLVSNSSLVDGSGTAIQQQQKRRQKVVVSLMKAGLHVSVDSSPESVTKLVNTVLTPMDSKKMEDHDLRSVMTGQFTSSEISEVTVLICGHGGRDERCGVMGPLLQDGFHDKLPRKGINVIESPILHDIENTAETADAARVGLVSHVGGHVFAGNVILYIPRSIRYQDHPLAGKGVWYGRVQPQHIEGIVEKTIKDGVIIEDLLRGIV